MASTSTTWPRLDPAQQKLLLNALSSNKRKQNPSLEDGARSSLANGTLNPSNTIKQASPDGLDPSTLATGLKADMGGASGLSSAHYDNTSFPNIGSPTFDFDLGLGANGMSQPDDYFGFDTQDLDGETGEKRKSPEDDDDETYDLGDAKRRGSDESQAKKPGRKPLTTEPTTKRKAQNRAAQRAFRERKEKHVKDLELKVMDLEKASESANHENGVLRAQVERLQDQLKDYKRRISVSNGSVGYSPTRNDSLESSFPGNFENFEFSFPKFGSMPASQAPVTSNGSYQGPSVTGGRQTQSPTSLNRDGTNGQNSTSISGSSLSSVPNSNGLSSYTPSSLTNGQSQSMGNGMFGNGFFGGMGQTSIECPEKCTALNGSSMMMNHGQNNKGNQSSPSGSGSISSASPAASNNGPSSSCCTSPDPVDGWFPDGTSKRDTSGSHSAQNSTPGLTNAKTPNSDMTHFDWLAAQNEGQFDPVLFGDYRDTQDAIVGDDAFTSGFFDDGFGISDFGDSFFNTTTNSTVPAPVTSTPKPNLMQQVAQRRNGDEEPAEAQNLPNPPNLLTCHKIWNQLQDCPKFKSGEFDVDSLCAELSSKAKCTETGVGVPKDAVEAALWKLAGKGPDDGKANAQPNKA